MKLPSVAEFLADGILVCSFVVGIRLVALDAVAPGAAEGAFVVGLSVTGNSVGNIDGSTVVGVSVTGEALGKYGRCVAL